MTRMTIAIAVSAVLMAGSAMAQTTPPPTQGTPPPVQIPPSVSTQKPTTPTTTPKPTPVPFPADAKIAYVDLQRVVAESALGKQGMESMKVLNDKLSAQLAAQNKQIQALQDKMKTQQNVVTETVFNGMVKELDRLQREAQFISQDAQVQVDQKQKELLDDFQQKVLPIVEDLRKERNLWMIFALGENSNIAAANAGLDLSEEVVKLLDAKTKVK
jgi:outer membrane protein